MSLIEDERRSVNPERHDPEHLGRVEGRSLSLADSPDQTNSAMRTQGTDLDSWDDPNLDPTGSIFQDESPYAEVRSAVANTDDPMMPSSTFRAWVIGIISVVLISGVSQFFYFRYPGVSMSGVCLH